MVIAGSHVHSVGKTSVDMKSPLAAWYELARVLGTVLGLRLAPIAPQAASAEVGEGREAGGETMKRYSRFQLCFYCYEDAWHIFSGGKHDNIRCRCLKCNKLTMYYPLPSPSALHEWATESGLPVMGVDFG